MAKILVIGQTPPPYGGQALMTRRLVEAKFEHVEIIHVRLAFSKNFIEVGKASWKKVLQVFSVAMQVWKHRLKNKKLVLYYMPAGPNRVPIVRDLLLLSLIRPLFSKTIYHFRAAGISEYLGSTSGNFQRLSKFIYGRPEIAIQLSDLNPKDAAFFNSKKTYYVPNGMEDCAAEYLNDIDSYRNESKQGVINILFVGVLREDKGFTWLLNSLGLLRKKGVVNFQLLVMGEFSSEIYRQEITGKIEEENLNNHISFLGVQSGEKKWNYYAIADFLCFPTFFDCESFGNVLVEAMMFQMPVIGSMWRGVPEIISNDVGFLVPVKDVNMLAEKIELLIKDKSLRIQLGQNARKRYLAKYTLDRFLSRMQNVFQSIQ
jgi:Glycosyltransferase